MRKPMLFDVFICHASEDKNSFVRPLAEKLKEKHIEVWYDEFSLSPGDSLRRSIDIGLSKSRYGIVVLSRNFIKKEWSNWELDGLVQRQIDEKTNLIIPIWHKISKKDVIRFSPPLADKIAIMSNRGLDSVVSQIIRVVKPEGSTLLIARDILLEYSYNPPVVTDDWWLDVIEFSASNPVEGTFQEASGWGRWGFPLPPKGKKPSEKGRRLALSAMQMLWQKKANHLKITQITHPNELLEFISSTPGLAKTCHKFPHFLSVYAPQLTIRGFGGEFEKDFDEVDIALKDRVNTCHIDMALRYPSFGGHKAGEVACNFVLGDDPAATRPETKVYEIIDYIVWFLSDQSKWMPDPIHKFILKGFKEWPVWLWFNIQQDYSSGFKRNVYTGSLARSMFAKAKNVEKSKNIKLTKGCLIDIETRFEYSINLLKLKEKPKVLAKRFIEEGFIREWIRQHTERKTRK